MGQNEPCATDEKKAGHYASIPPPGKQALDQILRTLS